jgi:ADP-heptose:LPS heptosyltransferase
VRNDRLGDTILALPTVYLLKRSYPDSKLAFCCAPEVAALMEHVDIIDDVMAAQDNDYPSLLDKLHKHKINVAICLRATQSNARALWKAGIGKRIGTSRRLYSFLFNYRVRLSRRRSHHHEADLNIQLVQSFVDPIPTQFPQISLPQEIIQRVEELTAPIPDRSSRPLVILHPGSGGSARNWPVEYFRDLAIRLSNNHGYPIVVTGTESEKDICSTVAGSQCLNLCGKMDLLELAGLLTNCEILIANSTGPLHLAVALGRKVLGLYPPVKDCLPERWGPYGHPEWALLPDLPLCRKCRPGRISECRCMESLTPDIVYKRVREIIGE